MLSQLLRTSLGRSASILNISARGVSKAMGTMYVAPSSFGTPNTLLSGARSFSTTFGLRAAAIKRATAKKTKTLRKTTTRKKVSPAKKRRVTAAKKKPLPRKPLSRKKRPVKKVVKAKKKAKKVVKPKTPRLLKKDITPPFKRPETPWIIFVKEYYQQHKQGETGLKEHLPKASVEWKQMTDEQKAAYSNPREEWDEYIKKRREWRAGLPHNIRLAIRRKRKDYRSGQKTPLNTWFQYVKENYHKYPFPADVKHSRERFKVLHEYYKTHVTDAEKQALTERAAKEFQEIQTLKS